MKPAIAQTNVEQHAAAVIAAMNALRESLNHESKAEERAATARQVTARCRLALGRELMAARMLWPQRGPKAKGWGEFLANARIDQDVALDAMKYAGFVAEDISRDEPGNLPTLAAAGIDKRPRLELVPAPIDVPAVVDPDAIEIDRDTWCTPKWITDALGAVDLDPCANDRSHVQARSTFRLDRDQDGLELAAKVGHDWTVFLNPPYSDVGPWIQAYGHTRFCFLLKFDPSTKWFAELFARTGLILIPRGTRVQFEAPEGVPPEKALANQFPHALFFARADDAPLALLERCFVWRVDPAV